MSPVEKEEQTDFMHCENESQSRLTRQPSIPPFDNVVDEYLERETNRKVVDYLREFLKVNNRCYNGHGSNECKSVFGVVSQGEVKPYEEDSRPFTTTLRGHEMLLEHLENGSNGLNFQALIAENICPYSICLFGMKFDIKPRFWATHFEKSYQTQREDVDLWLSPLPSSAPESDPESVNIQYLEPRELIQLPHPFESLDTIQTVPRPLTHYQNYAIERSGGKHYAHKVNRDVQILPGRNQARVQRDGVKPELPVALIPGPLSVWTRESERRPGTDFMVILIDPKPSGLEMKANFHLDSSPNMEAQTPTERMANYLSNCHTKGESITKHAYHSIGNMISKQWQVVQGYMLRDLHRIQLRLEDIPTFDVAERMLKDLFTHRQNCTQYNKLLEETKKEFEEWGFDKDNIVIRDLRSLQQGFGQISATIGKNVNLLTGLTAIKEARQGLEENHGITTLTQVATIYLPFSTVAAVLSMPGSYAPGQGMFWVYWVASVILAAFVIATLVLYRPLTRWIKPKKHDKEEKRSLGKNDLGMAKRRQTDEELGIVEGVSFKLAQRFLP
ncbi:hypothetical protein F4677DRAFT_462721 [Hypoxylon crocopeplum]|nr:hypothetical protein F4677DRAFT_462721 [Hypoxylon crocopeplum]